MSARWVWLVVVAACGGGLPDLPSLGDGGADAMDARVRDVVHEPEAAPFTEGPHGLFPQALSGGGPINTSPIVTPVFFGTDALQVRVESFLGQLSTSTYWSALMTEYGVGALSVASSIILTDTPPTSVTEPQVASYLASKFGTGDPAWRIDSRYIYVVYYPATTTISLDNQSSCNDILGYHSYGMTGGGGQFTFAVIARCSNQGWSVQDQTTATTSHELVEATTDPGLTSYFAVDTKHAAYMYYPGSELGDLCETEQLSYQHLVGTYFVQRFWSNSAAALGNDPCVPPIPDVFYDSIPVLSDPVTIQFSNGPVTTSGVIVPAGQSATIDVQLYSVAATSDWSLDARDASYLFNTGSPELSFSWDQASGNNGDTRKLTITRLQNGPYGGTMFGIFSSQSQTSYHAFYAFAGN